MDEMSFLCVLVSVINFSLFFCVWHYCASQLVRQRRGYVGVISEGESRGDFLLCFFYV